MVSWIVDGLIADAWLLAEDKPMTVFQRLDRPRQAKVLAALAAFIILGIGLVLLAWVGARVTRRYMNQEPLRRRTLEELEDDWASKPIVRPESKMKMDDGDDQE